MKKLTCMILSLILAVTLIAAAADEVPQPEGGKKFEADWAVAGMLASIVYEEEGYRVFIDSFPEEEGKGIEWSYSCLYREEDGTIISVSSCKQAYTLDPENEGQRIYAPAEYDGFDDEGAESMFSIDENGRLHWKDGHENMGADLEFANIGRFAGSWKNAGEGVYVIFDWDGRDADSFFYHVIIQRVSDNMDQLAIYVLNGTFNEETGKLECSGGIWSKNSENQLETDGETYDAIFSMTEGGSVLYETANGIELAAD